MPSFDRRRDRVVYHIFIIYITRRKRPRCPALIGTAATPRSSNRTTIFERAINGVRKRGRITAIVFFREKVF